MDRAVDRAWIGRGSGVDRAVDCIGLDDSTNEEDADSAVTP